MRTTIEIPDAQRARLLEIAARRGDKGFSRLVQEAIDFYLDEVEREAERAEAAVAALGRLDDSAADRLEETVRAVRSRWR